MTDEELIESLRLWNRDDAADRIEELIGKNNNLFDLAEKEHSRAERLEAALREIKTCTTEHGGAAKALRIIRAALQGDDHE